MLALEDVFPAPRVDLVVLTRSGRLDPKADPGFASLQVSCPRRSREFRSLYEDAERHRWPLVRGRFPVLALATGPDHPARLVCGDEARLLAAIVVAVSRLVERHGDALAAGETGLSESVELFGHRVRVGNPSGGRTVGPPPLP